ncbi:hypothetical protein KR018_002696 [Drosophila ironensis]|nr:hypothetical protein KR018_002696 [Drosophila ironensis]
MRLGSKWIFLGLGLMLEVILLLDTTESANILAILPYRIPSPYKVVRPLVQSLTSRGHRITMVTPLGMLDDIDGVRHIRIPLLNKLLHELLKSDKYLDILSDKWSEGVLAATVFHNISYAVLSDDGFQNLLRNRSEHFDMVLLEASRLDALYGLAEYYNATLVGFSSVSTNWMVDLLAGNLAPAIYEPLSPMGYSRDNTLMSMLNNWLYITEEKLLHQLINRPSQLRLFQQFFGYSASKLTELQASFSLVLINTHFSVGRVSANVPNIIEVGGMHLSEAPEPCDQELQRFLDEAEHGVIYFSLGMDVFIKFLPADMKQHFLQSFAQLRQRVVWKNELPTMPNKSDNVYVVSWSPQRAILDHPNVRLFITNGGILSVMEAIDSAVPMLGLPMFFDQFKTMQRVRQAGMAEVLDTNALSADTLTSTILELMNNPKYSQSAKKLSQIFRDRPMSPLDTAVWWMEYALRHRNVSHIRLKEEDIPFLWYYQLDSLLSCGLRFGIVMGSLMFFVYKLVKRYRIRQRQLRERSQPMVLNIIMPRLQQEDS